MFDYVSRPPDRYDWTPRTVCLLVGWFPFFVLNAYHDSPFTEWLSYAYLVTGFVIFFYPFERKNLRQPWFWKTALVTFGVAHPAILAGIWFVNASPTLKPHTGKSVQIVLLVSITLELFLYVAARNFFRPENDATGFEPSGAEGQE